MGKRGKNLASKLIQQFSLKHSPTLDLYNKQVKEQNIQKLASIESGILILLFLGRNKIYCHHLIPLLQAKWLNLRNLHLGQNKISNKGIKYIVMMNLPQLQILTLDSNKIDDYGMMMMIKGNWKKMTNLSLSENYIIAGCQNANQANWKKLNQLRFDRLIPNQQIQHLFDFTYIFLADTRVFTVYQSDLSLYHKAKLKNKLHQKFEQWPKFAIFI